MTFFTTFLLRLETDSLTKQMIEVKVVEALESPFGGCWWLWRDGAPRRMTRLQFDAASGNGETALTPDSAREFTLGIHGMAQLNYTS